MSVETVKPLRSISFGGGIQSTALVLLAMEGRINYDVALFANVGDDSEHPGTLTWIRDVMQPLGDAVGFPIYELQRTLRDGTVETLHQRLTREGSNFLGIPIRLNNGMPGRRSCTADHKIKVVGKWLKANGASKDNKAHVAIGFSVDEIHRANPNRAQPYEIPEYPLLDMGWTRHDCEQYILTVLGGLPPRSACYFCPFHRRQTWAVLRRDEPDLFAKSVALEQHLNQRQAAKGKKPVYLTDYGMPLDEAVAEAQETLPGFGPDAGSCDDGFCWT